MQAETLMPLLINGAGAARLLGIVKSLLYEKVSRGRLGPVPIGLNFKKLYYIEECDDA